MSNTLSYVHGASGQALIGQTIGRYFDEACARHAGQEALVVRHQGDPSAAHTLLTEIGVRWPGFGEAQAALADPTYGLRFTDAATIDTRTDYWDADTATTDAQRAALCRRLRETGDVPPPALIAGALRLLVTASQLTAQCMQRNQEKRLCVRSTSPSSPA